MGALTLIQAVQLAAALFEAAGSVSKVIADLHAKGIQSGAPIPPEHLEAVSQSMNAVIAAVAAAQPNAKA